MNSLLGIYNTILGVAYCLA